MRRPFRCMLFDFQSISGQTVWNAKCIKVGFVSTLKSRYQVLRYWVIHKTKLFAFLKKFLQVEMTSQSWKIFHLFERSFCQFWTLYYRHTIISLPLPLYFFFQWFALRNINPFKLMFLIVKMSNQCKKRREVLDNKHEHNNNFSNHFL